jgi:membrane-associated PAP2 superfamily phosphatase
MNRTGLVIALAVGVVTGLVFGFFPHLDLQISGLFYDPQTRDFTLRHRVLLGESSWPAQLRNAAMWIVAALAIPAGIALGAKCFLPNSRMRVPGRAIVFLLASIALAPGLLVNVVLKEHWDRPRPVAVQEFNGPDRFVAWWDPRGACRHNCSFVAGEASGAFWTLAPAALAPAPARIFAYAAALAFGSAVGALRMAFGGHFFTDVVFAGVFTFLIIWLVHAALYRWRRTAIADAAIERAIERIFLPPHAAMVRLLARLSGRAPRARSHPGGT